MGIELHLTDLLQYVTDLDQIDFEFKRLGQVNYEKRRRSIFIIVFIIIIMMINLRLSIYAFHTCVSSLSL